MWIRDTQGDLINVSQIVSIRTRKHGFGDGLTVYALLPNGAERSLVDIIQRDGGYSASLQAELFINRITGT